MTPEPDDLSPLAVRMRARLLAQAADLDLTPRGPRATIARARRRRARRQAVLATLAVGALATGVAVALPGEEATTPVVSGNGEGVAPEEPAPDLPPLDLSWSPRDGGLTSFSLDYTIAPNGTLFALSTAPGAGFGPKGQVPPSAVYRLEADGTWAPTTPAEPSRLADLAATDGVLYAMSTEPGAGGRGQAAVVSSSADGGATWTPTDLPTAPPPSSTAPWTPMTAVGIEQVGGVTAAVASTSFTLPREWLATHVPDPAARSRVSGTDPRPEGLAVLATPSLDELGAILAERNRTSGTAPGSTTPGLPGEIRRGPEVAVIPWSVLGVPGPEAVRSVTRVFVRDGDGWEPVDVSGPIGDVSVVQFGSTGGRFVLSGSKGWAPTKVLVSSDGRHWQERSGPPGTGLAFVGAAWVVLNGEGSALAVSSDQGATWQERPLATLDPRLAEATVSRLAAGPLGLFALGRTKAGEAFVLASRDLRRWTHTSIREIAGDFVPSSVSVGEDRVVLVASKAARPPQARAETVTVVGTPVR